MKNYLDKSSLVNIGKAAAIALILYIEVFFFKFFMKTAVLVNSKVSFENAVVLWEKYHIFSYHIKSIFYVLYNSDQFHTKSCLFNTLILLM